MKHRNRHKQLELRQNRDKTSKHLCRNRISSHVPYPLREARSRYVSGRHYAPATEPVTAGGALGAASFSSLYARIVGFPAPSRILLNSSACPASTVCQKTTGSGPIRASRVGSCKGLALLTSRRAAQCVTSWSESSPCSRSTCFSNSVRGEAWTSAEAKKQTSTSASKLDAITRYWRCLAASGKRPLPISA